MGYYKKQMLTVLQTVCLFCITLAVAVIGTEITTSDTCNQNVGWELIDGVL